MTTQEQVRLCTPLPYKAVDTLWYTCHVYVCGEKERGVGGVGGGGGERERERMKMTRSLTKRIFVIPSRVLSLY